MLTSPISSFIKQNISAYYPARKFNTRKQNLYNYSSLAPLAYDTVSFKGSEPLNKSLMDAFDNVSLCQNIHDNGVPVKNSLLYFLKELMKPYMYNPVSNPDGIVQDVITRVKTPDSIREKAASILAWAIKHDTAKTFNPEDIDAIKENCSDIIGGRIILRRPTKDKTSHIIDALIEEVKTDRLKITRIENYVSTDGKNKYEYFRQEDLERLKKAVHDYQKKNIEVVNNQKDTGYMALHLDVNLSNPEFKSKNDGYRGEIQIVGYDVSRLKDVEDLCYKLKSGKEIKNGHPAYRVFSEYFRKYMDETENPNIRKNFEAYTKKAYILQRLKEPTDKKTYGKKEYSFPTPEECNMFEVPNELDFNRLAKLKQLCDEIYEMTQDL